MLCVLVRTIIQPTDNISGYSIADVSVHDSKLFAGTEAISKIAGYAELTHIGCKSSADTLNDQPQLLMDGQTDEHQRRFTKVNSV